MDYPTIRKALDFHHIPHMTDFHGTVWALEGWLPDFHGLRLWVPMHEGMSVCSLRDWLGY